MATQALPSYLSASTFTSVVDGVTQTGVATVVVSSVLPTQQLPSYLSASTFITTADGVESTGTTLVRVPLTYIGPSIPLGTDGVWTFLGSTTPASLTSTQPTATPSSPTQSTSISSSASPTTSSASSSFSSQSSTESGASSTTPSASPTSTTSAAAAASSGLSTAQLIGIIIAAVIVALVIILLLLLCFFRRRRQRAGYQHPNMSEFVIVDSEGQTRLAGEGSPRPTGEEEDSFLRGSRSGETANEMQEIGPTARLVQNPSPTATERTTGTAVPPEGIVPTALKTPPGSPSPPSGPKLPSPFFHASASSLFFNPTRGPDQSLVGAAVAAKRESASTRGSSASTAPSSPANGNAGKIIPSRQLMQMSDQWHQESNEGQAGAIGVQRRPSELGERMRAGSVLRPPPAFNADTSSSRQDSSIPTMGSHVDSPRSDPDERTTLLMAHRFNMSEGGPPVLVQSDNEASTTPSSWRSSLGFSLQGLRLSRLSWFQRMNLQRAHTPSSALPTTRSATPSRQQLRTAERSSLVVPRPVSHLTASSTGDTTYYDAPSGPPTMSSRSGNNNNNSFSPGRPTSMPLLPPRAVVVPEEPASSSAPQTPHPEYDQDSGRSSGFNRPALLMLESPTGSAPSSPRFPTPPPITRQPQAAAARREPTDILDTPVPPRAAVSPFSTTSTRGGPSIPPGLENLANIRSWRDSSSDMPSSATFGEGSDREVNVDVIGSGGDVLEEGPPMPSSNWTQLRAVTVADTIASNRTRRTLGRTLGQVDIEDPLDDVHSARASLHLIPDRLSPLSPMGSGSGSRAPSRQYNSSSLGSSSSQSFGQIRHVENGTSGSSGSLLGHSNSITSDGRRRPRREPGEPALSPSTSSHFGRARLSAIGGHRTPITSPQRSPAADATFAQAQGSTAHEGTGALLGRTT